MWDDLDIAQVCRNGHIVNGQVSRRPERNTKFCSYCGESTLMECEECHASILGDSPSSIGAGILPMTIPYAYCHECGKPYPWTRSKIDAALELIELMRAISEQDKQELKDSLPDLAQKTPKSDVAAKRWQAIAKKVGGDTYSILIKVATDIASEYTKKILTGLP